MLDDSHAPIGLAQTLLEKGFTVVIADFLPEPSFPDQTSLFFTTYNRTHLQECVRDLMRICNSARNASPPKNPASFSSATAWLAFGAFSRAPGSGRSYRRLQSTRFSHQIKLLAFPRSYSARAFAISTRFKAHSPSPRPIPSFSTMRCRSFPIARTSNPAYATLRSQNKR